MANVQWRIEVMNREENGSPKGQVVAGGLKLFPSEGLDERLIGEFGHPLDIAVDEKQFDGPPVVGFGGEGCILWGGSGILLVVMAFFSRKSLARDSDFDVIPKSVLIHVVKCV